MLCPQISDKVRPPKVGVSILTRVAAFIPTSKIVPSKDITDDAFRDPVKRKEVISFSWINTVPSGVNQKYIHVCLKS